MKFKLSISIIISIFFSVYLLFNIYLLPHYGMSWDEPFHYLRGQIYLQYFLTGNGDKFESSKLSLYQNFDILLDEKVVNFSFLFKNDSGHPPLNGILASVFNRLFYQNLGILGDLESYHLFVLLVSIFLVFLVFFWTYKEYGIFAGIIAFLSITLYPLFFAESHFNIKDPVEASFYAATLYFFYKGVTRSNWKWIIISSIFAGFALGTKFNIVFIIFTILPWFIFYKWREIKSFIYPLSKKLTFALLSFPLIALGILYATWPFLWQNPINNLLKILLYYKEIGSGITYQPVEYLIFGKFNTYALQWIFYTTPLVILFFSFLGIVYSLRHGFKEKNKTSLLILFWLLVPILRVTIPNAGIYNGTRQIMEYIPAMAILAGIGASYIVKLFDCYIVKKLRWDRTTMKQFNNETIKLLFRSFLILSFIPITLKLVSIHPNENVYFNPLIGGLAGAKEKNIIYWGNTFGNAYRQGVEWLNKNVKSNAKVARGTAYETTVPSIWFREDIKYSSDYQSGFEKKGEYIFELTHDMPVWSYYYYFNYAKNMLKPLYEIKVDDVPILTIWKNDWENTKDEFKKEEETLEIIDGIKKDKNYLLIDVQKEVFLTGIEIIFANPSCHFTKDGYFVTSDDAGNWTNHPGDLSEMTFYENFNPRGREDALSYLFPGVKTRLIKIIHVEDNNCFEDIKKINVKVVS